jgi:PAS domain S-box-containing protein
LLEAERASRLIKLPQSIGLRYALALFVFALSALLRAGVQPWLASDHGFVLFLPGIILVTFVAGLGPAILTAAMSCLVMWYVFIPPAYSFLITFADAIGLAMFVLASAAGIALVHLLRATLLRLQTAREEAEALAAQREALFEADPNGLLVVDGAGRIQLANSNLMKLFGYSKDELIGQSVEVLVPERFRDGHALLRNGFVRQPSTRPMGAGRDLYGCRKDGSEFPVEIGLALFGAEGSATTLANVVDITKRKQADEVQKILMHEIEHRNNNLLAVIQAIASRSFPEDLSPAEAKKAFEARLQSLARTTRQLTRANWTGVELDELVQSELATFNHRATVEGDHVLLGPQSAQNLSLAVHELATNAAKYGALSNKSGQIYISWTVASEDGQRTLKFKWQETGGPRVIAPTRQGFGTTLLKTIFANAQFEYPAKGLSYEFSVQLERVEPKRVA